MNRIFLKHTLNTQLILLAIAVIINIVIFFLWNIVVMDSSNAGEFGAFIILLIVDLLIYSFISCVVLVCYSLINKIDFKGVFIIVNIFISLLIWIIVLLLMFFALVLSLFVLVAMSI